MERAFLASAATALAGLPELLGARGWLDEALAQSADVTEDTLSGLVAFILPGDDPYSKAQGQSANGPGGIGAGTVPVFIAALDEFVPASSVIGTTTLPASGAVAALLNQYATRVNPAASGGTFPSPFARLSFDEKAKVFEMFESDPAADGTELKFVSGILPGFVAFVAFSEAGVADPATRNPKSRPVGWEISGYSGPVEGHGELRGYWHGHRSAIGSNARHHRHRHRHRRHHR